jgi:hypothetical protein
MRRDLLKQEAGFMECVNTSHIISAIIALLLPYDLKKLFPAGIGENRGFYIAVLAVLGIGLFLRRSGAAVEFIGNISGITQSS